MFRHQSRNCRPALMVLVCILVSGCSYGIKYPLTAESTPQAATPQRLKVAVAVLDDARNEADRQKSARKERGDEDFADYTYDKDFGGKVAPDISSMMAEHLTFAGAFEEVHLLDATARAATPALLDSLQRQGVDAVMIGKVERFYGYYDQRPGKKALAQIGLGLALGLPVAILTTSTETTAISGPFGPIGEVKEIKTNPLAIGLAVSVGGAIGAFLESSSARRVAWHTQLSLELLETATGKSLWAGTANVEREEKKSMPGLNTNTRKHEVAVSSLKAAVNDLVHQLSAAELRAEAR